MEKLRLGLALTGSFCTLSKAMATAERLCALYDVTPILSETVYGTDTRFGAAREFIERLESLSGRPVLHTVAQTEPIGPRKLLDLLIIAPCTGNTTAKLAHGIADTSVTMAAKAHLRNGRPLVVAISSNDALTTGAANLGTLMARRGVYLVPFRQDDAVGKPGSLVAEFSLIEATAAAALEGRQLQPLLL